MKNHKKKKKKRSNLAKAMTGYTSSRVNALRKASRKSNY